MSAVDVMACSRGWGGRACDRPGLFDVWPVGHPEKVEAVCQGHAESLVNELDGAKRRAYIVQLRP